MTSEGRNGEIVCARTLSQEPTSPTFPNHRNSRWLCPQASLVGLLKVMFLVATYKPVLLQNWSGPRISTFIKLPGYSYMLFSENHILNQNFSPKLENLNPDSPAPRHKPGMVAWVVVTPAPVEEEIKQNPADLGGLLASWSG